MKGSQELPKVLLLLTVAISAVTRTETHIRSEKYQQHKDELSLNFTRVDLNNARSQLQCSRACSEDSSCIGVGIQERTGGKIHCFKMNNDSAGDSQVGDQPVFLKGMFIADSWRVSLMYRRFLPKIWRVFPTRDKYYFK